MSEIKIINAKKIYHDVPVIENLNITIPKGSLFTLLGPSGCGKTTLLRMIAGFNSIEGGEFYFDDTKINNMEPSKRNIGMVFQRPNPFAKSIYKNITFPHERAGVKDKKILDELVETSLKQAALWDQVKDDLHKSALTLSGGQQQRLCIARAISVKPDILLMDEPASALDPIATAQLEETMLELKKDYTIVIVTHSMQQAARASDYTGFFYLGNLIEYDKTSNIFQNAKLQSTNDYVSGHFG